MNSVLSVEEIDEILRREFSQNDYLWSVARAIEAAVLAKFEEASLKARLFEMQNAAVDLNKQLAEYKQAADIVKYLTSLPDEDFFDLRGNSMMMPEQFVMVVLNDMKRKKDEGEKSHDGGGRDDGSIEWRGENEIKELADNLRNAMNNETVFMRKAADSLESQAQKIKQLKAKVDQLDNMLLKHSFAARRF